MQLDQGQFPVDDQLMHAAVLTLLSQNGSLRHLDVSSLAATACAASLSGLPLLTKLVWRNQHYRAWDDDEEDKEAQARRQQQVIPPQYAAFHEMMYR